MGNLSHTVGGTDNLVSFKSAARVPIDSLKVHFSPIQEGKGDPSPENVRPIRGWNEVEAYRSGKNVARITGYNATNTANADIHSDLSNKYGTTINTNDYSLPDTSVIVTQTQAPNVSTVHSYQNGYFAIMVKNLIYDQYYDISFKITDITNNLLNCDINTIHIMVPDGSTFSPREINGNRLIFKNVKWKRNASYPNRSNFEIRNCGISFTLSEFMVTPVGMNDGVFEPYCGEVMPVTFPAEVGTIYGGYVDLAKGEFVAEWAKVTKKLSDYTSKTEYDDIIFYDFQPLSSLSCLASPNGTQSGTMSKDNSKCSIAPYRWSTQSSTINHYYIYRLNDDSTRLLIYLMPSSIESEDMEFEIAFRLKDPIHYSLTSTQLRAFLDQNTFWSNTNDVTEVSYAIHDTAPIRAAKKRIMAASPKLETLSSDLVTFNSDVAAPLKECKVYFEPVQEGEGDPSPENIRPIIGWTSVDVYKSGKNLIRLPVMTRTIKGITWTVSEEGSIQVDGTATDNTWMSYWHDNSQHVDFYLKAGTYALSRNGTPPVAGIYLVARDGSTTTDIGRVDRAIDSITFTLKQDTLVGFQAVVTPDLGEIHTIIHPQLELLSSTDYEAPNNSMIPITFPAEAGTIYGGYVDLVNGEIVQEYELVEDTWGNIKYSSVNSTTGYQYGRLFFKNPVVKAGMSGAKNVSYCNVGAYVWNLTSNATPHFYIDTMGNTETTYIAYITLPSTTDDNLLITCATKLINPIRYPITHQALKTLRGINNIWSTSNGPISIKYWKH